MKKNKDVIVSAMITLAICIITASLIMRYEIIPTVKKQTETINIFIEKLAECQHERSANAKD